jgi:hypothetical protein
MFGSPVRSVEIFCTTRSGRRHHRYNINRRIVGYRRIRVIGWLIDDSAVGGANEALVRNHRAVDGIRVHNHIECDDGDVGLLPDGSAGMAPGVESAANGSACRSRAGTCPNIRDRYTVQAALLAT